ncbi:pentatricopeptide repeat-containing protein At4g26680, mitochondrial-like [Manihot esculenta]|uniref:pentatricopeptide repeat-containing protein At4g26680, mitochondrial-like n=1 Tax=Manihot esculenta TaxID=3983 RepID=UPI000B5D0957|nr:pentatricopeptide repeat-containing protein At4g26680, mitochondrial-like [Manihot esculenta]
MRIFLFRQFSTLLDSVSIKPTSAEPQFHGNLRRNWNSIPIPKRTLPEPKGQDLDFINVAHSHLIHTDWDKLNLLSTHFTPFRVKHIPLRMKKDHVLSLEFFNWVKTQNTNSRTLETHSIILHTLTQNRRFKSAELILKSILIPGSLDIADKLFDAILYSHGMCDSSPRVFDSLFKTYAHMKRFRNATDALSLLICL